MGKRKEKRRTSPAGAQGGPVLARSHSDRALVVALALWAPSAYRWVGGDLGATAAVVRLAAALALAHLGLRGWRALVAGYRPAAAGPHLATGPPPGAGPPRRRATDPPAPDPLGWDPTPEPGTDAAAGAA